MNNNENNDLLNEFNNMFGENKTKEEFVPYKAVSNNTKIENINQVNLINNQTNSMQTLNDMNVGNNQVVNDLNSHFNQNHVNLQNTIPNIINNGQPDVQNIIMPEVSNLNTMANVNNVQSMNTMPLYDTSSSINDIKIEKKVKKNKITINKELQSVIILAVILFIFILFLPVIFDLFDNLKNTIFR